MCTVTYIPLKKGFLLTSSRDEKNYRPTLKPKTYIHSNTLLVYPKDEIANGTWIAANYENKVACLLNGAFRTHRKKTFYKKSRGQILLDCFGYNSFEEAIVNINLEGVEPFTLLLIDYKNDVLFNQLVWDGIKKNSRSIRNDIPQIWSSVTLYSKQDRELRKGWFEDWVNKNKQVEDCNIFDFHSRKHGNIDSKDILMKRENDLQTVSISQLCNQNQKKTFLYYDFKDNKTTKLNLSKLKCTQV